MVNLPDNLFNQFAYKNYVSWPKQSFQQSLISLLLNGPTILGKKIGLTLHKLMYKYSCSSQAMHNPA